MRIALDCTHQLIGGGIRAYISSLVHALASELGSDDELVLHYRLRESGAKDLFPPLPESRALIRRTESVGSRRLRSRLENHLGWPRIESTTGALDVFHGTHFWLPVSRGARCVLSVHDLTYLKHPEYFEHRKLNDYGYRYLLPHSLNRADAILACSESTERDLIEISGVPKEKIWVVPYAPDPRFQPHGEEEYQHTLRRFGITPPFVIYPVGTLDRRKNIDNVLKAYRQAFPKPNRPQLILTSPQRGNSVLESQLVELGLEQDVRTLSVGYPHDLAALMSAADWGLYLSLYEGYGLPVAEALACGLPMVVSNSSSIPEVAGNAALVVDPNDSDRMARAFLQLQEDDDLRRELRRAALERAQSQDFSWQRVARQTLATYQEDRSLWRGAKDKPTQQASPATVGAEASGSALL